MPARRHHRPVLQRHLHFLQSAAERQPSGHHLVEDAAERVDVAARTDLGEAEALLGRHVAGGAEHQSVLGHRRDVAREPFDLGEPEVEHLDGDAVRPVAPALEEDVLRLEVPVDDAGLVRGGERIGDPRAEPGREIDRHRVSRHALRQRPALEELHHQVGRAVGRDAEVEHVGHARVRDLHRGHRLGLEAAPHLLVAQDVGARQLDRDLSLDAHVAAQVDDPHAARRQHAHHGVRAEEGADARVALEGEEVLVLARVGRLAEVVDRDHVLGGAVLLVRDRPRRMAAYRQGRLGVRPDPIGGGRGHSVQVRRHAGTMLQRGCPIQSQRAAAQRGELVVPPGLARRLPHVAEVNRTCRGLLARSSADPA